MEKDTRNIPESDEFTNRNAGLISAPLPYRIPLPTPPHAISKRRLLLRAHPLGEIGKKVWRTRFEHHCGKANPERGSLGNEKAASADADQQHGDGGNFDPTHFFLAQTDQTAMKIVPRAPITD